ncbi:MAG: hypothetical protein R2794_01370 [Chitinophagales bacterium]
MANLVHKEIKEDPVLVCADTCTVQTHANRTIVNGKLFTGVLFSLSNSSDTLFTCAYTDGFKNGKERIYYPDKQIQWERFYDHGMKTGTHSGYRPDGSLKYQYHFKQDETEGSGREWFANGQLYMDMHYKHGKESGQQTMYYANGKIRSNYIMQNNRRYGLLGTKNCSPVSVVDTVGLQQ